MMQTRSIDAEMERLAADAGVRRIGNDGARIWLSVSGGPYAKTTRPLVRPGSIVRTNTPAAARTAGEKMVC